MKRFVKQLEDDFVDNIDDLINLDAAQLDGYKIPTGVYNRLKIKMKEHKAFVLAAELMMFETEFVHKECWIFYEVEYDELRTLKGCECLGDLTATSNDASNAEIIAKSAGIDPSNIKKFNKMKTE